VRDAEQQLIDRIVKGQPTATHRDLLLSAGDDAALWRPRRGYETILTCDWFVEGNHFLRGKHPPDSVGWKCLARAVSDIAAMGGRPSCFLLSLALPESTTARNSGRSWLDEFLRGLRRASSQFRCALAGGDLTRKREILINITVVGQVATGRVVLRSGAIPGDILFVSGVLGEAELGLRKLRLGKHPLTKSDLAKSDRTLQKHLYPEPRLALGSWLADRKLANSMMDISDGLSTDLPKLCAASRVGARIDESAVPITRAVGRAQALKAALNGGDDYELLFTVPPAKVSAVPPFFQGLTLSRIGEISRSRSVQVISPDGKKRMLTSGGWDPFRADGKASR
jgi:thiamine-monophosphate kinase